MNRRITIAACLVACASWASSQVPQVGTASGVISGTLKGDDGSVIATGLVTASGIPDSLTHNHARTSASAMIKSDGTFVLPNLQAGTYRLCVQIPNSAWLNPCEWGPGGLTVSLSSVQPSANVIVDLKKGALFSIRIDDPTQLLSAKEGTSPGADLLVGVGTDAMFFRTANMVSQDASGRNYQVLIPFGRTVGISVTSGLFQLADATGKILAKSDTIPITVASGQQTATLVLTVKGSN